MRNVSIRMKPGIQDDTGLPKSASNSTIRHRRQEEDRVGDYLARRRPHHRRRCRRWCRRNKKTVGRSAWLASHRLMENVATIQTRVRKIVFIAALCLAGAGGVQAQDDCRARYDAAVADYRAGVPPERLAASAQVALDCYGASWHAQAAWLYDTAAFGLIEARRYRGVLVLADRFFDRHRAEADSASRAKLYQRRGTARYYTGDLKGMYADYQQALALASTLPEGRRHLLVYDVAYFYRKAGHHGTARWLHGVYEAELRQAEASQALYMMLVNTAEAAASQFAQSEELALLDSAATWAGEAAGLAEQAGDDYWQGFALLALCRAQRLKGQFLAAERTLRRAEAVQQRLSNSRLGVELLRQRGLLHLDMFNVGVERLNTGVESGQAVLIEALRRAEEHGLEDLAHSLAGDLVAAYAHDGEGLAEMIARGHDYQPAVWVLAALGIVGLLLAFAVAGARALGASVALRPGVSANWYKAPPLGGAGRASKIHARNIPVRIDPAKLRAVEQGEAVHIVAHLVTYEPGRLGGSKRGGESE